MEVEFLDFSDRILIKFTFEDGVKVQSSISKEYIGKFPKEAYEFVEGLFSQKVFLDEDSKRLSQHIIEKYIIEMEEFVESNDIPQLIKKEFLESNDIPQLIKKEFLNLNVK